MSVIVRSNAGTSSFWSSGVIWATFLVKLRIRRIGREGRIVLLDDWQNDPTPPFFNPKGDEPSFCSFEVRYAGNPAAVTTAIRAAVREVAPAVPPVEIRTMDSPTEL
jgi:hypothetical protein